MIAVPEEFAAAAAARAGEAGRRWVEELPDLIEALCERWDLRIDGAPMHGYLGLVVPVRRGGDEPCVLKVSWINESNEHEATALAAWNGRGAVRLLEVRPEHGAMLLERLDSRRSLNDVEIEEAVTVSGRLLRRLSVPAPDGPPGLQAVAENLSETLPERWEKFGRPMPRRVLDKVCELAEELGASADELLVNYDLHYGNVLAGEREPWLVIDPKVVAGDPEYGLAQLLFRRMEETGGRDGLRRRFLTLIELAELDPERARSWTLIRCVDYWLWALSIGLTEDPARCEAITDWLLSE